MSVRARLALTVIAAGLLTALLVIVTVVIAFERFERETTYQRATAFLMRVEMTFDNLLDEHDRRPAELQTLLRNLVLYEPEMQLYLLDAQGAILASTIDAVLPADFRVPLEPILAAARQGGGRPPYVMGQDPQRMDVDAVVAAQPLKRAKIRPDAPVSGFLYVVCHKPVLPASRWEALRSSFAAPALVSIAGIVALITALAALVIATVTRPLARLTDAVATLSERGLDEGQTASAQQQLPPPGRDEFGRLNAAFALLLDKLRHQFAALRRLDRFRREGVSNLSHDLRSPLTATVACLETLEARFDAAAHAEDRRLVGIALRNTRNAARLVGSLGDLATLDEPEYALRAESVEVGELLDDIAARFASRAQAQGVALNVEPAAEPLPARLDVELIERAVANLVDNALKFCGAGAAVTLSARAEADAVVIAVADTGPGIAAADLPHLFDRFYQARDSVAPATGEGGKGLGLAIVKRIAELHGGTVAVDSVPGRGTTMCLRLPAAQ
jgi:signal transduction histidine kinase